ncbi:MAG TPA: glycosyltransferase [Steroidobacteraceae bacterium]|jgi:sugar transferase (PEP-CTERM/EpsH1 system associated)
MPPVHVCHVVLSLEPGGLENGVINVVNGLNSAEFRSSVCCLQRAGEFAARLRSQVPVSVMGLRPGNDPMMPFRLARLLRSAGVDIVHTRNAEPFFYGLLGARIARVPVVVHSEHGRTFPERRLRAMVQRLFLRGVDGAFAVSEQLRADLVRELGIDGKRMEVLYNGVDTSSFRPLEAPVAEARAAGPVRIGSVGRLVPIKNYALLLHAFAQLPPSACRLLLVGEGPERAALERLAGELGIRDRVELTGHRDDVAQLLRTLDIFVLPSLSEGMSNTLLEAMATGIAAVASDVGGNREIIESERSGLLFASGDVAAAAAQLRRLIERPELRRALGGAAAARVRGTFSIEAMLQGYEELYRRLWRQKRGQPLREAAA